MKHKFLKPIPLILLAALAIATILSFQSQYVQIPVPTDVTPPLGHGRERLSVPSGSSSQKQEFTEPVEICYFGSMSFRHLDNNVVQEYTSGVGLVDGEVIVSANNSEDDCQFNTGAISTQLDSITLGKGGIIQAVVDKTNSAITIRSLHQKTTLQLNVISQPNIHDQHEIVLRDGQEITVPIRSSYRSLYLTAAELDKLVVSSDFVSIVKASPVLKRMRTSYNKNDRRVYNTAEKTAAALRQLH